MDDLRISLLRDESKHQREMIYSLRDELRDLRRERLKDQIAERERKDNIFINTMLTVYVFLVVSYIAALILYV